MAESDSPQLTQGWTPAGLVALGGLATSRFDSAHNASRPPCGVVDRPRKGRPTDGPLPSQAGRVGHCGSAAVAAAGSSGVRDHRFGRRYGRGDPLPGRLGDDVVHDGCGFRFGLGRRRDGLGLCLGDHLGFDLDGVVDDESGFDDLGFRLDGDLGRGVDRRRGFDDRFGRDDLRCQGHLGFGGHFGPWFDYEIGFGLDDGCGLGTASGSMTATGSTAAGSTAASAIESGSTAASTGPASATMAAVAATAACSRS